MSTRRFALPGLLLAACAAVGPDYAEPEIALRDRFLEAGETPGEPRAEVRRGHPGYFAGITVPHFLHVRASTLP